ncbi:conjugal transfer protein TraN [Rickettsia endosymbiont of Lasioglossum villosulum]|uniref:conjugal transfer protein TraN n=1 Tax=Rickettsia endosymbiont of Lasioglossum villosulum TaxID=3066269 RepID=UPI0031331D70
MLVTLVMNAISSYSATMEDSYNSARQYEHSIKLGNPNQMGNKIIFDKEVNISNLSKMNDQDLTNQGSVMLNNSAQGQLLQQSELKKINAMQEYDLNPDNPLISNSAKIEADPLKHTEGTALNVSEKVFKTKINKSCCEGAEFEIDIIRNLILDAELIDKWGDWQDKAIAFSGSEISNSYRHWLYPVFWKKKRHFGKRKTIYSMHMHNNQAIMLDVRAAIAGKLNVSLDHIDTYMGISSQGEGALTEGWDRDIVKWDRYVFTYKYRDKIKEFREKSEYFQIVNKSLEALLEEHECHEINRICLEAGDKLFFNQYNVNRPCWSEQIKYQCSSEPKYGCDHLKKQACELARSNCVKQAASICLQWHKDYICIAQKKEFSSSIAGSKMFCLGGNCHTATIVPKNDIASIGHLAMLNEMKKDMQTNPISVFKGHASSCRKVNIGNFLNCCSGFKGWGKDLGLSRCNAEEKALALKKAKGQCYYVGTYCAKKDKIFKTCITKKSTYCCFNSKLARVFQEQGKKQLAIGFGTAQYANCRGFTVEELQRIDFSKFDLEELFSDLLDHAKSKMSKSFPQQLKNQMPIMQQQRSNNNCTDSNLSY